MPNQSRIVHVFTSIVFLLICFFTLGYSIYARYFAEVHINLPFLDFPIFIGEMLLAVCLIYLFVKWLVEKKLNNPLFIVLGIYLFWVLFKAISGYLTYGPLSFRNAALFYYPLFIFIGYEIFNRRYFSQITLIVLSVISLVLIFINKQFGYYTLPWFLMSICLFLAIQNKSLKGIFFVILLLVFPISNLFNGGRSYFVGTFTAFIFLYLYFTFFLIQKRIWQIVITIGSIIFLVGGIQLFGNKNKIKSLITPGKVWSDYQEAESNIQNQFQDFKFKEIPAKIYNPEEQDLIQNFHKDKRDKYFSPTFLEEFNVVQEKMMSAPDVVNDEEKKKKINEELDQLKERLSQVYQNSVSEMKLKGENIIENVIDEGNQESQSIFQNTKKNLEENKIELQKMESIPSETKPIKSEHAADVMAGLEDQFNVEYNQLRYMRSISVEYDNIMFRLFIWRDMIEESIQKRAWFGISFGKPQRSKRIEISRKAIGEWSRDGWIAPHNSWLHFLYRGGVIGLAFIVLVFVLFFRMLKYFVLSRNTIGVFICAVLIYWFTIAHFLVTFELPYNAIPVWTLLGMIIAYKESLSNVKITKE